MCAAAAPPQGEGEVMLVAPGTPRLSLALGLALIADRWLTLRRRPGFWSFRRWRSALSAPIPAIGFSPIVLRNNIVMPAKIYMLIETVSH